MSTLKCTTHFPTTLQWRLLSTSGSRGDSVGCFQRSCLAENKMPHSCHKSRDVAGSGQNSNVLTNRCKFSLIFSARHAFTALPCNKNCWNEKRQKTFIVRSPIRSKTDSETWSVTEEKQLHRNTSPILPLTSINLQSLTINSTHKLNEWWFLVQPDLTIFSVWRTKRLWIDAQLARL